MKEFEKRIKINENRVLIYKISEGYAKPTYTITEGFIENGEVKKTYSLSQWDDYGLNGWINDCNTYINKISFEFDANHPLFFPLIHLLDHDNELLIDDDDTREDNIKYMTIYKREDKIYIDFINNLKDETHINSDEKFHVFIKNITFDGRSKIDQDKKDTKKRLFVFFNEVNQLLTNDYHQISIEEYILRESINNHFDETIPKKLVKKNKSIYKISMFRIINNYNIMYRYQLIKK